MGSEDEEKYGKKCRCDHFKNEHVFEPKPPGKLWFIFTEADFSINMGKRAECMKCSCSKYNPPKWYWVCKDSNRIGLTQLIYPFLLSGCNNSSIVSCAFTCSALISSPSFSSRGMKCTYTDSIGSSNVP